LAWTGIALIELRRFDEAMHGRSTLKSAWERFTQQCSTLPDD
jgi:hypothetical protein